MTKYVALLRGINVGGRIIKMADLKICFENLDFQNVKTLLQSGNVVFESDLPANKLKPKIEAGLTRAFNYPAKVWVISIDELKKIVAANPFASAAPDYHQYVIFFDKGLENEFTAEVPNSTNEEVSAGQGVAYWKVCKGQTLKSSRGKLLAKAKYRDFNTNRNNNTLKKLLD